ncbi:MAG: hypothetical protein ACRDOL_33790 [Streptosporangiaceae bacterium]
MAVTLTAFIGIQILVPTLIRPNLLPSTTVTFPVNQATASQSTGIYTRGGGSEFYFDLPVPQGAWVLSAPPVQDSSGQGGHVLRYQQLPVPAHVGPSD